MGQLGTFDTITGLNPWKKDKGIMGAISTFAAAQTAITIGAGATYPFDTVRRRLQMQSEKPVEEHIYKGTMDCFKKIAAEEGMAKGLYKGFWRMLCAALVGPWYSCFTIGPRLILASEFWDGQPEEARCHRGFPVVWSCRREGFSVGWVHSGLPAHDAGCCAILVRSLHHYLRSVLQSSSKVGFLFLYSTCCSGCMCMQRLG